MLVSFMRDHDLRRYLEIGARHGDTFHHVMSALGPHSTFGIAVDMPGGPWGTSTSEEAIRRAVHDLLRTGYSVRLCIGDSHSYELQQCVTKEGPFDLVFIDGDHRYDAVCQDFRDFSTMARYVAFHDIAGDGQTTKTPDALTVEVPRFWHEIRDRFTFHEFIAPGSSMGIGILEMPQ